jgi:F0F1-type ATP synthase alpha subunit
LLKQPQYSPLAVHEQVVIIFAGVKGYLDNVPVSVIKRFEGDLLEYVRSEHSELLKQIKQDAAISSETEKRLNEVLKKFCEVFV